MAITKIEYYNGATKIGERTTAPFTSFDWVNAPAGNHALTAKVFIDGVEKDTSPVVNIVVNAGNVFSGASRLYSVARKLNPNYTGSAIGVTTLDGTKVGNIGFTAEGLLDEQAILDLGAGSSMYITKIYDQSGNGIDWVTAYPVHDFHAIRISSTTAVDKFNGKPVALSGGTTQGSGKLSYFTAPLSGVTTASVFKVFANRAGGDTTVQFMGGDAGHYIGIAQPSGTSAFINNNAGTPAMYLNGAVFSGTTRGDFHTAVGSTQKLLGVTNLNLSAWTSLNNGDAVNGTLFPNHKFQEAILFPSDKSADRAAIEANINAFYGIY